MGSTCGTNGCSMMFKERQFIKEQNKKGIYPPQQIQKYVEKNWNSVIGNYAYGNKDQVKKVSTLTINQLGQLGNGTKFDEKKFNKQYKYIDPYKNEKNIREVVIGMITKILAAEQDVKG